MKEQKSVIARQTSEMLELEVENKQLHDSVAQLKLDLEVLQKKVSTANREMLQYAQMERNLEDLKDEKERVTARLSKEIAELKGKTENKVEILCVFK